MAQYRPLNNIRGIQTDFVRFQFAWDSVGDDGQMHILWIYKEDEMDSPRMWKYSQCVEHCVKAEFRYNSIPMQEIRSMKFLVFLSDEPRAPAPQEIRRMCEIPEFICEVCCGTGVVQWRWNRERTGMGLIIKSEKKIPQGLLFYEYMYGNKVFRFDIPGEIKSGENYYRNISFPQIPAPPQLMSRERNIDIQELTERKGFLKNLFRH